MKKAVALALVLAGISFTQQTQSGVYEGPKHRMEWCKQNWEKCKQRKLEGVSMKKECLEKSQSFEDYHDPQEVSIFYKVEMNCGMIYLDD